MNQTLQLTDYIPQYVSLYYVDYRDDLDEHEDIQVMHPFQQYGKTL